MLAAAGMLALAGSPAAFAAGGGNAGDVWTDNVGQPAGPGHEQDPHLACQDINLWGSGLADSSGTYTIDGWPPSGSTEQDYASTWSYNESLGGTQVLNVINVHTLIANAVANGDAPINKQGYHFKLQFSQDPHKHKTFWVNCPAPSTSPPPGTPGGPPPSGKPPTGTPPSGTPSTKGTVKKKHHKHHRLVHPKRHRAPKHHKIKDARVAAPEFTG
jgi:hypothetical protein